MGQSVTFSIDGQTMIAEPGETILAVATRHGIVIPTLCHNQKVSKTTSCFVCVVKHAESGRWLPSCAALPQAGQHYDSSTDEVRNMRRAALDLLLSEHTGDCEAPCTIACPAHAKVEEYVREGRKGDFLEGLRIIKQRIPLPLSIGRVCPRFCEKDCRRNLWDLPVAINDFKRLAADLHYDTYMEECAPLIDRKVAIVGGGPAGLAAAYYLRREGGLSSHIFEMMPRLGGMLRYGIPEYRLPKAILDRELAHFDRMGGITSTCNVRLGKDISLDELKSKYDAVVVAIGCWKASPMRCEGEELAQDGIRWLRQIALDDATGDNPGRTIVIGGGNTAMDCVRTAVRLGSGNVACFYRRTEKEMPAEAIEIREAKEEGVRFEFLTAPSRLRRENGKLILTCIRMTLGEPDASGRRRPVPQEGSDFDVEADTVIAAIGQATDAPEGLKTNRWGDVDATKEELRMDERVFAAGDCVSGAATVVEAVAAGRKAALAILDQLAGRPHLEPPTINVSRGHWRSMSKDDVVLLKEVSSAPRLTLPHIPLEARRTTFGEVTGTASAESVIAEGARCFECSCTAKNTCTLKSHSEASGAKPGAVGGMKVIDPVDIRHPSIVHDRNKCIKCGICIKICDEVIGKSLLGYKKRGFVTVVGPAFGAVLPDSCGECMACVDECPVGALDRRFKN